MKSHIKSQNHFLLSFVNEEKQFQDLFFANFQSMINKLVEIKENKKYKKYGDDAFTVELVSPKQTEMNISININDSDILNVLQIEDLIVDYVKEIPEKFNYWIEEFKKYYSFSDKNTKKPFCQLCYYNNGFFKKEFFDEFDIFYNLYRRTEEVLKICDNSFFEIYFINPKDKNFDFKYTSNLNTLVYESLSRFKDDIIETIEGKFKKNSELIINYWFRDAFLNFENNIDDDSKDKDEYLILGFKSSYLYQQWIKRLVDEGNHHKILVYDDWVKAVNDLL